MIIRLPRQRWDELKNVFRDDFDSELPHTSSDILADIDEDGTILGFMVVENLFRIGQIWQTGGKTREMFKTVEAHIPRDCGVIAISSDPRFNTLCEKWGMREVQGVVYRRDF